MSEPEHREPVPDREPLGEAPLLWADWDDARLLALRLCDLKVTMRGTKVADATRQLLEELRQRGIRFRPHFWLSTEWFCPDGVGGIAMPFYLTHPRLERLERAQMFEVEGGSPEHCMQLLRHEVAHALDNAYGLRRRRRRQQLFGSASEPYGDDYLPRPYSRRYVRHLEGWYAQSHPVEDFAETFAVWLDPHSDWRRRYRGWQAYAKLEYVEELMAEIAAEEVPEVDRVRVEPVGRLRQTLAEYYREKRERYGVGHDTPYERELKRIFAADPTLADRPAAADFIRELRKPVRQHVARWTGVYQYTIDQIIDEIVERCRELDLRLRVSEEQARVDFTTALTVLTMKCVLQDQHRYLR